MTIVIPMAGRGRRFTERGHVLPKYLLSAHGRTLLEWSVRSLPLSLARRLVFVALREHEQAFGLQARLQALFPGIPLRCVLLDDVTRGQAETVVVAAHEIPADEPLAIFNIDTHFASPTLAAALQRPDVDGVLGCFHSREPRFSFAATDASGQVTRVTEKEPISEHALTGLYHFRRAGDFLDVARQAIAADDRTKGEFYVAPLYNRLIARGARFVLDHAPVHNILGTPEEFDVFAAGPAPTLT